MLFLYMCGCYNQTDNTTTKKYDTSSAYGHRTNIGLTTGNSVNFTNIIGNEPCKWNSYLSVIDHELFVSRGTSSMMVRHILYV